MTNHEQQIEILTEKLNVLENESRRILNALQWATKVRMILISLLLIFGAVSLLMFFRLYNDVKTRRFAEVQRLINEKPAEFSEPLTRQIMALAEEQGPHVIEVFRQQAQKDSNQYMAAFDTERATMITNLQRNVEDRLAKSYVTILDEQEKLLANEFPVLQDPVKLEIVRANLEKIYQKIGKRYYVNLLKEELDDMAEQLDTFPPTNPKQANVPVAEQVATEFLELVRLMLIHSENYQVPESSDVSMEVIRTPKMMPAADVDSVRESKSDDEVGSQETEDSSTDSDKESKDKESKDDESKKTYEDNDT